MPKSAIARPTWWRRRLPSRCCSCARLRVRGNGSARGSVRLMRWMRRRVGHSSVRARHDVAARRGYARAMNRTVDPSGMAHPAQRLAELRAEHRLLDARIAQLQAGIADDELALK